ncbi:hypothetical protein ACEWY4_001798 [Coilia grayii]|uniref:Uncharacterized protein n=1 Tax=Coilia grayii TaxID=363190 RepID=A0ABD1KU12_9TELE
MWIFWFLSCCLAARQEDRHRRKDKGLKKKVKKYRLEELKTELAVRGVSVDEDMNLNVSKKKVKRELQRLLILELKKAELVKANGFTFPMDIPEDVMAALNELDARLDKEFEELENEERKQDVEAVVHHVLDEIDTNQGLTLAGSDAKHRNGGGKF